MMLKCMRKAQDAMADKDSPFNSQQVKFYRDMHDQQLAVDLSAKGNMGQTNYSATKAGVIAMTTTWAKELGQYGIRSAAIAPGFVSTPILESMKQSALEKLIKRIPLMRLAQPDEIAEAAEFIFTNDYFSGRVLELDGGMRI